MDHSIEGIGIYYIENMCLHFIVEKDKDIFKTTCIEFNLQDIHKNELDCISNFYRYLIAYITHLQDNSQLYSYLDIVSNKSLYTDYYSQLYNCVPSYSLYKVIDEEDIIYYQRSKSSLTAV